MAAQQYGYIRVSSRDQNEDRQRIAMREFGIPERNIFLDKQSGKDFVRPGYTRLIRKLKQGDTLAIKSIDRLGRNCNEILEQWHMITKEKKVAVVVLDIPLLDTRQGRDLTGTLIADIVLQLLSYVAQTEREFIRQRQAEGIAAAKLRGAKFRRPPLERSAGFSAVHAAWRQGDLSARKPLGRRDRIIAFPWGNEDTQNLIDIFDQYNVKATFFVVGEWVEKYPESVKALADAGHEVMGHSNNHAHFNTLSADEIIADINTCNDKVEAVTGVRPTLFRPPFGEYDDHVVTTVRGMGLEVIQWDVEPLAAPARA